jgi:hypothetical protein
MIVKGGFGVAGDAWRLLSFSTPANVLDLLVLISGPSLPRTSEIVRLAMSAPAATDFQQLLHCLRQ